MESLNLKIVIILTIGFAFASILGYLSTRAKLSPILGYLLAGYLIGPYSPGFIADHQLADQLAEIGVILMLFSVGLHFKWQDLLKTSHIAIPGAIGQTLAATVVSTIVVHQLGWPIETGIIFGLAVGVASTVVLVRQLGDNKLLDTLQGHIAVGWLIVEDFLTIIALLLIAPLALAPEADRFPFFDIAFSFGWAMLKFLLLIAFMFTIGHGQGHGQGQTFNCTLRISLCAMLF